MVNYIRPKGLISIMSNDKELTMREMTELIMAQAKAKGFGVKPEEINVPEKIALIHSEVTEAYEAYRNKKLDGHLGFREELGDIVQRVLHLAGIFEIDIEKEILRKLRINKGRTWDWKKMNETHVKKEEE